MGNVVGSVSSGFAQVIDKILGHPLEFLSGKNCNSKCAPTWDILCYVENFCVSHLLKLIMVAALVYFLLLFLFLVYKLGICQCICHIICGGIYACFTTCFGSLNICCTYICSKLQSVKRKGRRRRRDIEEFTPPGSPIRGQRYHSQDSSASQHCQNLELMRLHKRRKHSHEHMRRSLRPTSHRTHLKLSRRSIHLHKKTTPGHLLLHRHHHHIHVARGSRFSHKGSRHRTVKHHARR